MNKHAIVASGLCIIDWLGAVMAWIIFFSWRKRLEGFTGEWMELWQDPKLIQGVLVIPLFWILFYAFVGSYKDTLRASRLASIQEVLAVVVVGSLGLLFTVLSDDLLLNIHSYILSFTRVFLVHLAIFSVGRLLYLSMIKFLLDAGRITWNIHVIGDITQSGIPPQMTIAKSYNNISNYLEDTLQSDDIDELWIVDEIPQQLKNLLPILIGKAKGAGISLHDRLWRGLEHDYNVIPRLNMPFVSIGSRPLRWWQLHLKRLGDIMISVFAMMLLSPFIAILAWKVKRSSEGPIFFTQERIGRWGDVFQIYKFRTMYLNAEQEGPALADKNDPRCTPLGLWMRRWRLDEMPQFVNVIKGDMSFVGPRPERPFYSDQLIEQNHLYPLLWQVRPGITSWGQIKYGYAATIPEMLQRFRFDLLYMEHMGLILDLRIMYYTILVLLRGKGR